MGDAASDFVAALAALADEAPYHPTPAAAAAGWRLASVDAGPALALRYVRTGRRDGGLLDAAGGPYVEASYTETPGGTRVRLDGGGRYYEAWTDARLPRAGDDRDAGDRDAEERDGPYYPRVEASCIVFRWRGGRLERAPAPGAAPSEWAAETRSGPRGTVRRWRWGDRECTPVWRMPEWRPRRPPRDAAAVAAVLLGRRAVGTLAALCRMKVSDPERLRTLDVVAVSYNFLHICGGGAALRYDS